MTSGAEIEARLAAATPGPWVTDTTIEGRPGVRTLDDLRRGAWVAYDLSSEDAELIAHAPDDLRHLLDVIDERDRLVAMLEARIDRLIKAGDDMCYGLAEDWSPRTAWDEAKAGAA